jgi:hypothetical protein
LTKIYLSLKKQLLKVQPNDCQSEPSSARVENSSKFKQKTSLADSKTMMSKAQSSANLNTSFLTITRRRLAPPKTSPIKPSLSSSVSTPETTLHVNVSAKTALSKGTQASSSIVETEVFQDLKRQNYLKTTTSTIIPLPLLLLDSALKVTRSETSLKTKKGAE